MTHTILNLELGTRSYPIHIGSNIIGQNLLAQVIKNKQVVVISNKTVAPLFLESVKSQLTNYAVDTILLNDGEQFKNLETLNIIYTQLLEKRFDRKTTLIALGGGVVGDITGFAAATYQRGIHFIQIPTTLLAQVDSSVGGKTAVNHPLGKNMIGAFYQPRCVIADIDTLKTLPDREISAGLAEVIKYGLIYSSEFFAWLENNIEKLLNKDATALTYAIEQSCQIKASIVSQDEKEQGIRTLLNYGHTFGHAIETHTAYKSWLHGEAVGCGMLMAAMLSKLQGWLSANDLERILQLLNKAKLPTCPPTDMTPNHFMEHMSKDKKVADGHIRLVLLKSIGQAVVSQDYDSKLLQTCLSHYCQ